MISCLVKRGLNIVEYCRQIDTESKGEMDKKQFLILFKNLGLPFSQRDYNEIAQRYASSASGDAIDYEMMLRDANVLPRSRGDEDNHSLLDLSLESSAGGTPTDIGMYGSVLVDVKRMLLESAASLGKRLDDIYRYEVDMHGGM